jgi:Gpi18-like mannosyltransferase
MTTDTEQEQVIRSSQSKPNLEVLGFGALFALGMLARLFTEKITGDMSDFYFIWYQNILDNGAAVAFREHLIGYTPAFWYLFAGTTLLDPILPRVTAIKLLPILFDVISTYFIYRIVRIKYPTGNKPYWAAGLFFVLPTIFINSAHWGQMDALYTSFLIISLYFFLKEKPMLGMLAYALSFSIKFQAIFFIPFLVILFLKKIIPWWQFLLVPTVYIITCIPAVLLGSSWLDVLTIYLRQSTLFSQLSVNAPNWYIFVPWEVAEPALIIGFIVAFCSLATWIIFTAADKRELTPERMVLLALISVSLTPFVLPRMHERYFYPADALSLIVAFFNPDLWIIPFAFQLSSGLAYSVYLKGKSPEPVMYGAIINTVILIILIVYQFSRQTKPVNAALEQGVGEQEN